MKLNLTQLQNEMNELRKRREDLHYTGRADLDCLNKMSAIRKEVSAELEKVRAQIEVCPLSMLGELKQRENELLEWKRRN
jgi:hypothetical protein